MGHIVLLGDSIFDNRSYVAGGPAVIDHLQKQAPASWRASLAAVDGSVTADVPRQLGSVPPDATHLVVSAGGNDALMQISVLGQRVTTVGEAFLFLSRLLEDFEQRYRAMLRAVLDTGRSVAVCTIYNPSYDDPTMQRVASTGLMLFNDCIVRAAAEHRVAVLELRRVCTERGDYANPIEPSAQGGGKIAAALLRMVLYNGEQRQSMLFP